MIRLMNRKECLSAYQNEVWKQENPYQQWILQNEGKNTDVYGEVPDNSLRIMKMEECTSSFDLVTVPDTFSSPDGYAMIRLDVKIRNSQQLSTVMNKLNQIAGVMQVTRPAG